MKYFSVIAAWGNMAHGKGFWKGLFKKLQSY